jgi:hypothetical protein
MAENPEDGGGSGLGVIVGVLVVLALVIVGVFAYNTGWLGRGGALGVSASEAAPAPK